MADSEPQAQATPLVSSPQNVEVSQTLDEVAAGIREMKRSLYGAVGLTRLEELELSLRELSKRVAPSRKGIGGETLR